MPTFQVVAPCHKDLVLNSAFASDYGDLISNNRIDAWIYGHSHTNIDAELVEPKYYPIRMDMFPERCIL